MLRWLSPPPESHPLLPSDSPYIDHVPFVVEHLLVDVSRIVPHPAHDLSLFVYVLLLHRQVSDGADQILAHYLAVVVVSRFEDVPGVVYRALHKLTCSVLHALDDLACRLFRRPTGLLRDLAGLP